MKQHMTFPKILQRLAIQKGEEKLQIAFDLTEFARKLRKEGEKYAARLKEKKAKKLY